MNLVRWPLRIAMCVALLVAVGLPALAPASEESSTSPSDPWVADEGGDPERWWGAAASGLCGLGLGAIRYYPPIGMQPAVLAATIGSCALALLDALT